MVPEERSVPLPLLPLEDLVVVLEQHQLLRHQVDLAAVALQEGSGRLLQEWEALHNQAQRRDLEELEEEVDLDNRSSSSSSNYNSECKGM